MLQVVSPSCTVLVYASSGLAILDPVSVCFKWSRQSLHRVSVCFKWSRHVILHPVSVYFKWSRHRMLLKATRRM
ncbi:hypothetical protein DPMN_100643 [Dreissena polymorpha]|uniref:Uncharacterized protein n=1 Tax=Dreissena polymorpha TaxID=45954 RepID=A0A9D4LHT2_DREPO|nr:hypothetical protein DPMN_100643 [Dreissena polymorpha]